MAAEPCLRRWQLESLSTQVRPDRPCQPPEEENGGRQRVICVPLWFCFTSASSLRWPPRGGRRLSLGDGRKTQENRSKYTSAVTMDLFLVLKWLWAVSESFLYFSVAMFLISAFMDSQRPLTNKSPTGIISEILRTHNIWCTRKWSGGVCERHTLMHTV